MDQFPNQLIRKIQAQRLLILFGLLLPFACAFAETNAPSFTVVQEVRELSPDKAAKSLPVRIRGVVTYYDEKAYNAFFVQDATAGIHVKLEQPANIKTGSLIELEGVTGPGEFAPIIYARELRVLGVGRLPEPKKATYAELASGRLDSQWITIRGTARSVSPADFGRVHVDLLTGGQKLRALVKELDLKQAQKLINAVVWIQGVGYSRFNQHRQMRAPWMGVTSSADISVEQPAPGESKEVPISSLLQFNSPGVYGERVKVRGVLTLQKNNSLFIQQNRDGLFVQTQQTNSLAPGDVVEATGFPALGQHSPALEDAIFRKIGMTNPVAPLEINAQQALTGDYDSGLVRIRANLMNRVRRLDEQVLFLQADNLIFNAHLEDPSNQDTIASLKNGSVVDVIGICVIQPVENWNPSARSKPESFRVLLRSPQDIVVIKTPPWWTLSRLLWAIGIMAAIICAAVAWAVALKRRVRKQTEIIQAKLQHEAALEERSRIARELHDTLEQDLAGITMQLDTAAASFVEAPNIARQHLNLARSMSRHSFSETRRSVWDLRSHLLENNNLPTALREIAKPLLAENGIYLDVKQLGTWRKLPTRVENNLLRIAQEALTNAIKHASAKRIEIELEYKINFVRLRVSDDGRGFESDNHLAISVSGGHFGLLDMRERAERSGGHCRVRSSPGKGTEVIVEIDTEKMAQPPT